MGILKEDLVELKNIIYLEYKKIVLKDIFQRFDVEDLRKFLKV